MRVRSVQRNQVEELGKVPRVLTIAGSDSGGGAGIQADLKTFTALGVYGMSAITAVTAQNTVGVKGIHEIPPDFVSLQIRMVAEDIGVDAVKTGMLGNSEIIGAVAQTISQLKLKPVVVDPVMRAKGGAPLLQKSAVKTLISLMLPLAYIVTPNRWEAEELSGRSVSNLKEAREAARAIHALGAQWVIIKGGHLETDLAVDLLFDGRSFIELPAKRYNTRNTHGTGCTFASAIAANLAKGLETLQAIQEAKNFVTNAVRSSLDLGKGNGPVNHLFGIVPGVIPPEG